MAGALTLGSWPQATGFDTASYLARMQELFQFMMPEGILPSSPSDIIGAYTNEMLPFGDSTGMQVKVYQGRAFAKGIFAKINDADAGSGYYTLSVTAAHATLYRMDTIICRFNLTTGVATLMMLDGTAAALNTGPLPAAITQTASTWDVVIGYVFVAPAVTTITANDVKDMRVFSQSLARQLGVTGYRSPIINAGGRVAQRGTSTLTAPSGTYITDRFFYVKSGTTAVHTTAQIGGETALTTALLNAGQPLASTCIGATVTTADATVGASDFAAIGYRIEGFDFEPLYRGKFTCRFWVRDSVVGMHAIVFQNIGPGAPTPDRTCVMEYEIFTADTWEEKIIHVPAPPNSGTWNFLNGVGMHVYWMMHVGASLCVAPGAWQNANALGALNADGTTARTVNSLGTVSNTFRLYGFNIAPGNYCPPYVPPAYPFDEAGAQRYCWTLPNAAQSHLGSFNATTSFIFDVHNPVTMRAIPIMAHGLTLPVASGSTNIRIFRFLSGATLTGTITTLDLWSGGTDVSRVRVVASGGWTASPSIDDIGEVLPGSALNLVLSAEL